MSTEIDSQSKPESILQEADNVNPFEECRMYLPKTATWEQYMRFCIKHLVDCDEIHLLRNWQDSKGAKIEYELAKNIGIKRIIHSI